MTENTVREAFDESEQIIVGIEPCDVLTGGGGTKTASCCTS